MNEIYAIDPQSPEDLKDIQAMFNQFGFQHGRFIANVPSDWALLLREHLSNLEGFDRSRLSRIMDLHRDSLFNLKMDFRKSKSWVENANEILACERSIAKILASEPNKYGFDSLRKFLWDDNVDNESRGAHIPTTIDAYRKAVFPLLQHSAEIHLVDPYFQLRKSLDIHKGREAVLRGFLLDAEQSSRCEFFKIHFMYEGHLSRLSKTNLEEQIEDDLNKICQDININRLQVDFSFSEKSGHGRYIFSIKGGLQFDRGFEPLKNETNHVHWLSKSELQPIFKKYVG